MPQKMEDCFVIMPISDPEGYGDGHFKHIYDDIISKACESAGYKPIRADDVLQTNFIHIDVLKQLVEAPMAICDLSSRNPNVLFELGIRQAFDKPVVLIQEKGTEQIFDIAPLRYTDYRKECIYHEVLEDQKSIADAISATKKATDNGDGLNSIINLLSLTSAAKLKDFAQEDSTPMMQVLMSEIGALRQEFRQTRRFEEPRRIGGDKRYSGPLKHKIEEVKHMIEIVENTIFSSVPTREILHKGKEIIGECNMKLDEIMSYSANVKRSPKYMKEIDQLFAEVSMLTNNILTIEEKLGE